MSSGPYILGSDSNVGTVSDSATSGIDNLLNSEAKYSAEGTYETTGDAVAPGPNYEGIPLIATDSLFNPFYMFRYAQYGTNDGKSYNVANHKDINEMSITNILNAPKTSSVIESDFKKIVENPSATEIIRWATDSADQNKDGTVLGAAPYQLNDFLWCKFYGKIPNNRLLTLRRYPIPVEDNIQIASSKMPMIPLAQAVTWWGGDSGNTLGNVLGMEYGLKWKQLPGTEVQDIIGNEVKAENLLDAVGLTQANNKNLRSILLATLFDNDNNPFEATGYDEKIQTWIKEAYSGEGQYWNRILGPVNVINTTQIRDRGFDFSHNITLKFTYKLRSFGTVNPKVAMLDLISNFLTLTYNTADFWGGSIRYFQKTGYILPGMPTQLFEQGDFIGGTEEVVKYLMGTIQTDLDNLKGIIGSLSEGKSDADFEKAANDIKQSSASQNLVGSWVKNLMQAPLKMRALLDGRSIGEWHLTVGNPMSPFAVIGNLCLKSTTIKFSESLGLDDAPNEVEFTVQLTPGRPRAKQDIESMFNLGGGAMSFTPLPPPSSAFNSYGDRNSINLKNAQKGTNDDATSNFTNNNFGNSYQQTLENTIPGQQSANDTGGRNSIGLAEASELAEGWRPRIRKAYGDKFAESPILIDYFRDLKTKD